MNSPPNQFHILQVDELSDSIAKFLCERKVPTNSTIGVFMTNSPELIISWLGLIKYGARPAMLNTSLRGASLIHCVKELDNCEIVLSNETARGFLELEGGVCRILKLNILTVSIRNKESRLDLIGAKVFRLMKMMSNKDTGYKSAGMKRGRTSNHISNSSFNRPTT